MRLRRLYATLEDSACTCVTQNIDTPTISALLQPNIMKILPILLNSVNRRRKTKCSETLFISCLALLISHNMHVIGFPDEELLGEIATYTFGDVYLRHR